MRSDDILEKFVRTLSRFSDNELSELKTLFKHPNTSQAIIKLIESVLELRRVHSKNKSIGSPLLPRKGEAERNDIKREETTIKRRGNGRQSTNNFSQRIVEILQNKKLFPSTKDVVNAVNDFFSWGIKYEDYYKRGRRDLIQNCLRRFADIDVNERKRMIRSFVNAIRIKKGSENLDKQYRELFKILAGDE